MRVTRYDEPEMGEYRARLYKTVFGLAAAYNVAFGMWAVLWPGSFFDLFRMEPPKYEAIWQCLGMVVGLYGLLYAYGASRLDRAQPIVAIGFAGKVLGPIGWVLVVSSCEWPWRTYALVLFNDIIWWLPFGIFLLEGTKFGERVRSSAPYIFALVNAAAASAMLFILRGGMEIVSDPAVRAEYILENPFLWRGGWILWNAAGLSLLMFFAWWGARIRSSFWGIAACIVAGIGLASDLLAESLYIGWLPIELDRIQPIGTFLTGGVANGLYTLAGIILTIRFSCLRGSLLIWTWAIWVSGILLTASTIFGSVTGMIVSTALLMTLICPWAVVMGLRFGRMPR
ncbi:MAG: hypothetical protein IH851_08385 [Armatimonadetes bacterium]|nr:hypothetical protein [Armatimonadota bacterium]